MKIYLYLFCIIVIVLVGCQNRNLVELNESEDLLDISYPEALVPLDSNLKLVITPMVLSYTLEEAQFESRNISINAASYDKVTISWQGISRKKGLKDFEIDFISSSNTFNNFSYATHGLLPTFWQDSKDSSSSGIWLSRNQFRNLKRKNKANWRFDFRKEAPDWFLTKYGSYVVSSFEQGNLTKDIATTYPVLLDGTAVNLPAIRAEDNTGNVYYILDDYQNPLVLEFIYNPLEAVNINSSLMLKALLSYQITEIRTK